MPKFKVTFEQWVQEIATVEVEAADAEEAKQIAEARQEADDNLDWEDGPGADFRGVSEVRGPDGTLWLPNDFGGLEA